MVSLTEDRFKFLYLTLSELIPSPLLIKYFSFHSVTSHLRTSKFLDPFFITLDNNIRHLYTLISPIYLPQKSLDLRQDSL